MADHYRQTGTWVLPSLAFAVMVAWPFSYLIGAWAILIGLPAAAAVLFLLDRAEFIESDLGTLAIVLLLFEVGVFVALLVTVTKAQAKAVGWWLPVLEAVAFVAVVRWGRRALRRHRRQGKALVVEDLSLGEARRVMFVAKRAVERAGELSRGQPGIDRRAAVRDLRHRIRRRPELAPVVTRVIADRQRVWGWIADDDPRVLALAIELVTEAQAQGQAQAARPSTSTP